MRIFFESVLTTYEVSDASSLTITSTASVDISHDKSAWGNPLRKYFENATSQPVQKQHANQ